MYMNAVFECVDFHALACNRTTSRSIAQAHVQLHKRTCNRTTPSAIAQARATVTMLSKCLVLSFSPMTRAGQLFSGRRGHPTCGSTREHPVRAQSRARDVTVSSSNASNCGTHTWIDRTRDEKARAIVGTQRERVQHRRKRASAKSCAGTL
jgi:hypothetical protein